jgi:NTE family protein
MLKYDNDALTKTIKKYWDYEELPIKSAEGQPSLLLIAVDVLDTTTIIFDSYPKKGAKILSIYGNDDIKLKHQLRYDKGIGIEHLLTTMSSHIRLNFPTLNAITGEVENNQVLEGNDVASTLYGWVFILVIPR